MAKPPAASSYPPEGKPAPAFTLPAADGKTVKLSDSKGKNIVVLYFYARDDTSGCTREACGFRDEMAKLRQAGVEVLGVSPDSADSHARFSAKLNLPFPLLADEDHRVAVTYGVWQEKTMYGRKTHGIARTTFIIDRAGRVAKVFAKVKPDGHAQEVLDWIRANLKT
jgi:peroxiredoxin Q/BCP